MKRKLLLAAMFIASVLGGVSVSAQINALTPSEVANGEFYVYNIERGMYIVPSNNYGTRAGFDKGGIVITVNVTDDGTLTLVTNVNGAGKGIFIANGNGETVYVDNTPTSWTFECIDNVNKVYTLKNGDNYLQAKTGETRLEAQPLPTDKSAQWQFIAKEVRQDISAASATNPVDVTYLLENQGFDRYNGEQNAWKNADNSNWRPGDGWCRNAAASNNCGETWNANFDIHQTITDAPNGIYELRMQGYYRISGDNNSDVLISKLTNGEDVLRTKYYLNNTEAFLMHQFADPLPDNLEGSTAEVNGTVIRYPNSKTQAAIAFSNDYFENTPIQAVVNDGVVTIGLKLDNKNGADWNCFDNFRLYYLGLPDVSQYVEALQNTIEQAEAFDATTTSTVLAEALNNAIAAGRAALSSTDSDELAAAEAAISSALNAAKAVNVSVLRQTVAVTEAGIDLTAANNAIANALTKDEADNALFDLRTARKLNALKTNDIFKGSAPEDGVEYFFYNIGTGMWLNNGSDWNTHTAVDIYALPVTLVADGENFKLKNHAFYRDEQWINFNAYVDTGNQDLWFFEPVEGKENVYNIVVFDRHDLALGYNPYGHTDRGWDYHYPFNVAKEQTDMSDPNNQWKLVSRAELEAIAEKADKYNPADVSYLIQNPGLSRVWDIAKWTKECDGGNGGAHVTVGDDGDFNRNGDYGYEVWNSNSFSFTQQLTGLKPGVYEVSVNGFYRQGDGGFQAGIVNEGGELISEAYLMANDEKVYLPNIATEAGKLPGIFTQNSAAGTFPNWPAEALNAFETGLYKVSLTVNVGEDGILTLGVKQDQKTTEASWTLFDSFRLTYKGEPVTAVTLPATWNFSNWEAGKISNSTIVDGLTVLVSDPERTIDIDASKKTVEGVDYTQRLKLGGNGTETNRTLTFLAPGNFNIEIVLTSANTSNERTLNIATGEFSNVVATMKAAAGDVKKEICSVEAELEEPVYIYSANSGINLYAIYLTEYDATVTGITEVATDGLKGQFYNLQGQKVNTPTKGLYIINGVKVIVK